jgi:hypothetical protein
LRRDLIVRNLTNLVEVNVIDSIWTVLGVECNQLNAIGKYLSFSPNDQPAL